MPRKVNPFKKAKIKKEYEETVKAEPLQDEASS